MGYEAKVLADSIGPTGVRLTTVLATAPRFVLAEINTHRTLSRSSASSRAIPVEKRIAAVAADLFIPESFGRNRAGMQATEALSGDDAKAAAYWWARAAGEAVNAAQALAELGVHKQYANRLLEPFAWHAMVITATEWANFFALRCHPDAQPEIRRFAEAIRDAMAESNPREKAPGEWHLPFVDDSPDEDQVKGEVARATPLLRHGSHYEEYSRTVAQVSCARAARVSYLLHDGTRSVEKDLELARRLRASGHMAPFEHAARPIEPPDEHELRGYYEMGGSEWCGNFRGWVQYRKLLPHEADFGRYLAAQKTEAP